MDIVVGYLALRALFTQIPVKLFVYYYSLKNKVQ